MRCSLTIRLGSILALALLAGLMALPTPSRGQAAKKGKKYALLVGVNTYEHQNLKALKFTENDVEAMAELLRSKSIGFDSVRLLTSSRGKKDEKDAPTAANIRKEIDKLLDTATGEDMILIAFSGHGVQLEIKDPDEKGKPRTYPYFCPSDSDFRNISYGTGKAEHLIQLQAMFTELGKSRTRQKLVLIDACRNELEADSSTRSVESKTLVVPKGVGVLFSCESEKKSWEKAKLGKKEQGHGVFFHFVIEGLSGKAKNKYNDITLDGLSSYVKLEVTRQTPKIVGGGATQIPYFDNKIVGETILARFDGKTPDEPTPKAGPDKGKEITNSIGMKLALIPAGGFTMGSPADEKDRRDDEGQRAVTIPKAFYMGVYEVTQDEYKAVMGKNPSYFSPEGKGKAKLAGTATGRFPVDTVSCVEAKEFCEKLTEMSKEKGRVYRLPTEAEWEYVCRAGTKTATHHGNTLSSKQANFNGNYPYNGADKGAYLGRTWPVGSNDKPNAWGLHDMHGNVWEWTLEDAKKGSSRVIRGGSWDEFGRNLRSARREMLNEKSPDNQTGFRVVCEPRDR